MSDTFCQDRNRSNSQEGEQDDLWPSLLYQGGRTLAKIIQAKNLAIQTDRKHKVNSENLDSCLQISGYSILSICLSPAYTYVWHWQFLQQYLITLLLEKSGLSLHKLVFQLRIELMNIHLVWVLRDLMRGQKRNFVINLSKVKMLIMQVSYQYVFLANLWKNLRFTRKSAQNWWNFLL